MITTIYIDLSVHAHDETHLTLVESSKGRPKVRFSTIGKGLPLDSIIHRIAEIANKYKVTEDQVHIPNNPAAEELLRRRLPKVKAFKDYVEEEML
jgi:hypothetical protein